MRSSIKQTWQLWNSALINRNVMKTIKTKIMIIKEDSELLTNKNFRKFSWIHQEAIWKQHKVYYNFWIYRSKQHQLPVWPELKSAIRKAVGEIKNVLRNAELNLLTEKIPENNQVPTFIIHRTEFSKISKDTLKFLLTIINHKIERKYE